MNDFLCGYTGDREAALMAYLYDDITPQDRAEFDTHLATCARCRTELAAFGGVRRQLAQWTPPAFVPVHAGMEREGFSRAPGWRHLPAWVQVAAAMLFLGVAAGIANVDVHYDARNGLNIHTGWSRATRVQNASANPTNPANLANPANSANPANLVNRADLAALERTLRAQLHAPPQPAAAATASGRASASNDAEVLRQVRVLIDQSERRQQSELALRVAALSNEITLQRQNDLRRIDMSLGRFQDSTGVEVLRNRQKLDYLLQRVSQQP